MSNLLLESGRAVLEHKIQYCSPEHVVAHLREAGDEAIQLIERGLCGQVGSPSRKTFAAHCLRQDRVETWRAVVEANFGRDSTRAEALARTVRLEDLAGVAPTETPAEAAVLAASPEGLSMVLEMDPSDIARTDTLSGETLISLHVLCWRRLQSPESYDAINISSARSPRQDLLNMVACCELLLNERAPWDAPDAKLSGANAVVFSLAADSWPGGLEFHLEIVQLLSRYVNSGMLSLTQPIDFKSQHVLNGYLPLAVAAAVANPDAVGAFIRMGLPLESGLPPAGKHTDLLEMLASSRRKSGPTCLAAAKEAIMSRRLELEASQSSVLNSGRRRLGL